MNSKTADTRQNLLRIATDLVERLGYNAFSYRDLAEFAKITTASIHYHFPTKGDLGLALVEQQREMEAAFRERLDSQHEDPWKRLSGFCEGFLRVLENGHRMCLCGMLAAEGQTLPDPVAEGVRAFFRENEEWMVQVLLEGQKAGSIAIQAPAAVVARALMSAIEGAMLVAKACRDVERFHSTMAWHLAQIKA